MNQRPVTGYARCRTLLRFGTFAAHLEHVHFLLSRSFAYLFLLLPNLFIVVVYRPSFLFFFSSFFLSFFREFFMYLVYNWIRFAPYTPILMYEDNQGSIAWNIQEPNCLNTSWFATTHSGMLLPMIIFNNIWDDCRWVDHGALTPAHDGVCSKASLGLNNMPIFWRFWNCEWCCIVLGATP